MGFKFVHLSALSFEELQTQINEYVLGGWSFHGGIQYISKTYGRSGFPIDRTEYHQFMKKEVDQECPFVFKILNHGLLDRFHAENIITPSKPKEWFFKALTWINNENLGLSEEFSLVQYCYKQYFDMMEEPH